MINNLVNPKVLIKVNKSGMLIRNNIISRDDFFSSENFIHSNFDIFAAFLMLQH